MGHLKNTLSASLMTSLIISLLSPATAACLNPNVKPNASQSPATRVALLELYTSEGCDSCPPADRWLESVLKKYPHGQAIPLALHVDYWDYIGWKDRFASPEFGARHSDLVHAASKKTVYTPQVFSNGKELTSWRNEAQVETAIAQINRQPASVQLRLEQISWLQPNGVNNTKRANVANSRQLTVQLDTKVSTRLTAGSQAYIAVLEDDLVSKVTRGENAGATLQHTSVVRAWRGPFTLDTANQRFSVQFDLPNDAQTAKLRVVAFAQAPEQSETLQAVALGVCW